LETENGNSWIVILIFIIPASQFLKFYFNIYVGEQFYPNARTYDDEMRLTGKDGRDLIRKIPKDDRRFVRSDRRINGAIMYRQYIYFLIPYWNKLPKTSKGRKAGIFVAFLTLLQITLVIILCISAP
jgi:hypothetical protein